MELQPSQRGFEELSDHWVSERSHTLNWCPDLLYLDRCEFHSRIKEQSDRVLAFTTIEFDGKVHVWISNRACCLSRKPSKTNRCRMKLVNKHTVKTRWKRVLLGLSGSRSWSWRTRLVLDYFQRNSAMVWRQLVCLLINNPLIFSIHWLDSINDEYVGSRHSSYIDRCGGRVLALTNRFSLSK